MRKFLVTILAISMMGLVNMSTATAATPKIVVIGDSITARYNSIPGDDNEGWFSMLARKAGHSVVPMGEAGSGVLRYGNQCQGTRYFERLSAALAQSPDILIIEGGRNDFTKCITYGEPGYERTSADYIEKRWNAFLDEVKARKAAKTQVWVMTPWGTSFSAERDMVYPIVKDATLSHGFGWVGLSALPDDRTVDGTHPNYEGNRYIYIKAYNTIFE